ncbi:hypothetical protein EOD39_3405 [Acipenser ruthenus]|uniref:Uncharacterized protein n=1 Tax=Acipenser ruthenus TaxID=7906 RepID=A0A444UNC2_ACIRT|nr:hypothetical protein EOD39_3405 [Acipenser ruthenus]
MARSSRRIRGRDLTTAILQVGPHHLPMGQRSDSPTELRKTTVQPRRHQWQTAGAFFKALVQRQPTPQVQLSPELQRQPMPQVQLSPELQQQQRVVQSGFSTELPFSRLQPSSSRCPGPSTPTPPPGRQLSRGR